MLRDFLSSREYTTRRNGGLPRFVVEFRENVSSSLSSFFPNPAFLFRNSDYLEIWDHILCFVWYTERTALEMFVSFLSRVRTFLDFLCSHRLRLSSHPFRTRRLTHINSCIHTTLIEQTSYTLHSKCLNSLSRFRDNHSRLHIVLRYYHQNDRDDRVDRFKLLVHHHHHHQLNRTRKNENDGDDRVNEWLELLIHHPHCQQNLNIRNKSRGSAWTGVRVRAIWKPNRSHRREMVIN